MTGYVPLEHLSNDDDKTVAVVVVTIDALPDADIIVFIIIKINSITKTSDVISEPQFTRYGQVRSRQPVKPTPCRPADRIVGWSTF